MAHPLAPDLVQAADANQLAAHVWPSTAARVDGAIVIGGASLEQLAAEHGTPLQIVDEADARARAEHIAGAFTSAFERIGTSASVYYAGKAFLQSTVARWMLDAGLGIDVCTGGELALALAAGVPGDRIGFHGNNKSVAEIAQAVEARVGTIVIDSAIEVERIAAAAAIVGIRQRVRLRINVGVHASTHEFLATSHEDQKFGVTLDDAPAIVARIRELGSLDFVGLHTHIGSQILVSEGFTEAARRILELHAALLAGGDVPEVNLGGGFGIAYVESDEAPDIAGLADALADFVRDECDRLGIAMPRFAFEPGRSIIGPAGVTLYRVGTVKPVSIDGATRMYVAVDGGMSDNPRTALYGASYAARIADRVSTAAPELARVVGKHCESGDIVVDAEWLPADVRPGDLLAVPATGAYCASLSSNYNAVPRPAIVAVRDGRSTPLVRRETIDDLLARDAGLGGAL